MDVARTTPENDRSPSEVFIRAGVPVTVRLTGTDIGRFRIENQP